ELLFVKSESTFSYFEATRRYIDKHGKPLALYSDKAGGLAPIFPYTFYHLTHDWFVAADIPVANDTPVHYADA
ncbi:hypothetical protein P9936_28610, partial [Serratia nevei]|uniref:hypothetical protein n=1 Tax=Serratia nevei TaxID=2703794 RepID=UPI002551BB32